MLTGEMSLPFIGGMTQNFAPIGNEDFFTIAPMGQDQVFNSFNVLLNDWDPNGDTLTATLESGPSNAAAFSLSSNGQVSYTPNSSTSTPWVGYDDFVYRVSDGQLSVIISAHIDLLSADSEPPMPAEDPGETAGPGLPPANPAPAPAPEIHVVDFQYPEQPDQNHITPWGFQFQWQVQFSAGAAGKLYYQTIHTRLSVQDANGMELHSITSDIVDIMGLDGSSASKDTQDSDAWLRYVQGWLNKDNKAAKIVFTRRADLRVVDSASVDPVGPAGPVYFDPAVHGSGMAYARMQISDDPDTGLPVDVCYSWMTDGNGNRIGNGGQLFDGVAAIGQASYRIVWWDKVNSNVKRPTRANGLMRLTMMGRLKFDQGVGGAAGANGLPVFPDKTLLDSMVSGGIDRQIGPRTIAF